MVMEKRYEPAKTSTSLKYLSRKSGAKKTKDPAIIAVRKRRIKLVPMRIDQLFLSKSKKSWVYNPRKGNKIQ
ncbi:MAG TPA: hypothetical protein DCY95_19560 [Algoriphagus sp.]|nr:hypothetical protein [Algoriphagus sp.]